MRRLGVGTLPLLEPSTPAEPIDLFARVFRLSVREFQVLDLLGDGLGSREIAGSILLSETPSLPDG